jgi:hypothetical protein
VTVQNVILVIVQHVVKVVLVTVHNVLLVMIVQNVVSVVKTVLNVLLVVKTVQRFGDDRPRRVNEETLVVTVT